MPFLESMFGFKQPIESSFIFSIDLERTIYPEEKPSGLFTTLEASCPIELDVLYHGLPSNVEKDNIEEHVGRLHLRCWQDGMLRLRAMFAEKT